MTDTFTQSGKPAHTFLLTPESVNDLLVAIHAYGRALPAGGDGRDYSSEYARNVRLGCVAHGLYTLQARDEA